jgi:hypothetical protein
MRYKLVFLREFILQNPVSEGGEYRKIFSTRGYQNKENIYVYTASACKQ